MNKQLLAGGLLSTLLLVTQASWGLAFDFIPQGTLPTKIVQGETLYAYYNVQNNTGLLLENNQLYLPPNVVQNFTTGPDTGEATLCGESPFDVDADGCLLKVQVIGTVNGQSTNPKDQIYICLEDGFTCAGTAPEHQNSLTVKTKPLQMSYIADEGANNIATCIVHAANGNLNVCTYATAGQFYSPQDIIVNEQSNPQVAYVANLDSFGTPNISICTFEQEGQLVGLGECSRFYDEAIVAPVGLQLSPDAKQLYVTNNSNGAGSVISCPVKTDGNLNIPCNDQVVSQFDYPVSFWIEGTFAYIANPAFNAIVICSLVDNAFTTCVDFTDPLLNEPGDIIINEAASVAYIANSVDNTLLVCDVDIPLGSLSNCAAHSDANFDFSQTGLQLSPDNLWLYATNFTENLVTACGVTDSGALEFPCVIAADATTEDLDAPIGRIGFIFIFSADSYYAYIANATGVFYCTYDALNGSLTDCQIIPDIGGTSVAIDTSSDYLYLPGFVIDQMTGFPIPGINSCPINSDGSITRTSCVPNAGFDFNLGSVDNLFALDGMVYVPNDEAATVSICTASTGALTCAESNVTLPDGRVIFATYNKIPYVYTVDSFGRIIQCTVTSLGNFSDCNAAFSEPSGNFNFLGIDLNAAGSAFYITAIDNTFTGSVILICPVDAQGDIATCEEQTAVSFNFDNVSNLFVRNNNNVAYVPDAFDATVWFCDPGIDTCANNPLFTFTEPVSVWTTRF